MKFEILLEDGEWRVVRAYKGSSRPTTPRNGRWIVVQHKCGGDVKCTSMFSDKDWSFCMHSTKTCSRCGCKVDTKMGGFHDMVMWNNEEDLP